MDLRWTAPDPDELRELLIRLGFRVTDRIGGAGAAGGERSVDFPTSRIVLDRGPDRLERLMDLDLERPPGSRGSSTRERGSAPHPNGIVDLLGVGWATVELERAARASGDLAFAEGAADEVLGARALVAPLPSGVRLVLLEPTTEGRVAASLARFGEGPAVLYLAAGAGRLGRPPAPARAAGPRAGRIGLGPFGREILLGDLPPWGPHLIACEAPREE